METPTDPICNWHRPSSDVEGPLAGLRRTSDSSEATARTDISVDEGHPAQGPDTLHQDTPQDATQNAHTPSPDIEDPRAEPRRGSHNSEPTAPTNISLDEGYPAAEPNALHQDVPLLPDPIDAASLNSQEQTSHDELGSGLQGPALDKAAERQHPRWEMSYFRLLFLVPFSIFLILMLVAVEVLHHISQHKQGLMTASEAMHYAWTYGPTFSEFQTSMLHHPLDKFY